MIKLTFRMESLKAAALAMETKDETRYYLRGVFVEKGLLVATDGRRLVVLKDKTNENATDHPEFIVPLETVKQVLSVKGKSKQLPLFVEFDISALSEKCFSVTATVYHRAEKNQNDTPLVVSVIPFNGIDGNFPNWQRVIPCAERFRPNANSGDPTGFDVQYLAEFKDMIMPDKNKARGLSLYLANDPTVPSIVRSENDIFDAVGVLSPMRTNVREDLPPVPEWLGIPA